MGDHLCVLLGILIFLLYLWKNGGLLLSKLKWLLSVGISALVVQQQKTSASNFRAGPCVHCCCFTEQSGELSVWICKLQSSCRKPLCCDVLWMVCWETYGFSPGRVSCCKTNGCTVSNTSRRGKICTSWSEKWGFQRGSFISDFHFKAARSSKVLLLQTEDVFFSFWITSWLHCRWIYSKHIEFNQTLWFFFKWKWNWIESEHHFSFLRLFYQ